MPLKPVNLDDRRYQDLLDSAIERARLSCKGWTDFSAGDPGRVLLELFAYLTEVMIYRLNRVPEKAYVEFLRLLGVQLRPPTAAVATLELKLKAPRDVDVEIPRGTRVAAERSAAGGDPPVFVTAETVKIPAGSTSAAVRAHHCERIEAELVGTGTGFPGQTYSVRRPPIIAAGDRSVDIFVGVEASPNELGDGVPMRRHDGKAFRIWQERESFSDAGDDEQHIYVLDRVAGTITFAPALRAAMEDGGLAQQAVALAAVPAEGREIRAWYCTGGGPDGNVAARTLTKLKDPVPGVALEVENPLPAVGGRSAETLEHAMQRGPEDLHSLQRAVTAGDFEALALRSSGGVARARAYTKHQLWKYAPRGTVEVVCIPYVPPERIEGPVTAELLAQHESADVLEQVRAALDQRRPLGTACTVRWGRCKKVRVKAQVVVYAQEDKAAVRERVLQRLYDTITPVERTPEGRGWEFGRPLSAYDVYRVLSGEPGVRYVDPIKLCVDDTPSSAVTALSPDAFQPATWYAASGDAVYRTSNGGDGWELIARIEKSTVRLLEGYPREAGAAETHAGLLAAIAEVEGKSRVYLSRDCGESWAEIGARPEFRIEDMAWTDRDGEPLLLLATGKGLYELATHEGAKLTPILVDPQRVDLGFYSVVVSTDPWGQTCVAVAAQGRAGVYLSTDNGKPGTFKHIGLKDEKVRTLAVQHFGAQRYLWAGMDAAGDDPGNGCSRWQLPESPNDWEHFGKNWEAGGCLGLAFLNSTLLAGTRRHGVVRLDVAAADPAWSAPDVRCGLPMAKLKEMQPIDFVAAAPGPAGATVVLAASAVGIYRSADGGAHYEHCSQNEFADRVTLPETWLFCSDRHDIDVKHDEAL